MSSADSNTDRSSIRFSEDVGPNSTVTLTKEIEQDTTIEEMTVRIYRGAELDLHVKPYIDRNKRDNRERREPLITYQGKQFIDGDGDKWVFPISRSVEEGETLGVEVENVDGTYTLDFSVDVVVDDAGGATRTVLSTLRGWL